MLSRYFSHDIFAIFVYGDDFPRISYRRNFFKTLSAAWIHVAFFISGMILLFFLRHGDLNRQNILIAVYMDIIIVCTGASSLRFGNRLEKIFFSILLFSIFLINTIALENFLFYTFLAEEEYRMDSMQKYVEFNAPTYFEKSSTEFNVLVRYEIESLQFLRQ